LLLLKAANGDYTVNGISLKEQREGASKRRRRQEGSPYLSQISQAPLASDSRSMTSQFIASLSLFFTVRTTIEAKEGRVGAIYSCE